MRSADRSKVNVLEMKCLKSLVGVKNEYVRRRAGIEKGELANSIEMVWACGKNG